MPRVGRRARVDHIHEQMMDTKAFWIVITAIQWKFLEN